MPDDVEVVIKIDKDYYDLLKNGVYCGDDYLPIKIITNGTLLPKGHGRLVDADYITKDLNTLQDSFTINIDNVNLGVLSISCNAPTIVEANTGE